MRLLTCLCVVISATAVTRAAESVENATLRVEMAADGRITIADKQTGAAWRQVVVPSDPPAAARQVTVDPKARVIAAKLRLPGMRSDGSRRLAEHSVRVSLADDDRDVIVRLRPEEPGTWFEVEYPLVFVPERPESDLVFPHAEGALIPLRRDHPDFVPLPKDWIYSGLSTYCACLGIVDRDRGNGLLTTFETPDLAGYEMADVQVAGATLSVPRIFWRSNRLKLDRELRLIFTVTPSGGYVALAKEYRRHFRRWGYARTLKEKAAANPTVDKLAGAPVFWVVGPAEDVKAVAAMMHEDGIERAVVEIDDPYWSRPDEALRPKLDAMARVIPQIRDLGYVITRYDQFRDSFAPDPKASLFAQFNTEAYPDSIVRDLDGKLRHGWPPGYVINPRAGLAIARKRLDEEAPRFALNGRFIDCVGTCPFWEGEDWSTSHPMDTQGSREARQELLRLANEKGLVVGTEGGIDCLLPNLHWLETPMSLVRWTASSYPLPGWLPAPLKPEYRINLSVAHRIPFYSLVHHDEVMITWRWEDGFCRAPEHWQEKNLWSVLYGNTPMFFLDRATYSRWRKEIAQTNRYVCDWSRRVAYATMESHRVLTPDRTVQETVFSNGLGVVVNFGKARFAIADGPAVPPGSYRTFAAGPPRAYSPPPVGETDYR
ncbi:glycoside hydrolase [Aquisphaera insulae]|uniref:glycoside hydrolase n=1 Tax=Aquisphaera insulae TaxID=2712864 RepID=UPI0013ECC483|nr:glycoside hydrolase [Aquisphaera insulae]